MWLLAENGNSRKHLKSLIQFKQSPRTPDMKARADKNLPRNRSAKEHEKAITKIIKRHFAQTRSNIPIVVDQLTSPTEVFGRHFRNLKDTPKDLVTPFIPLWNYIAEKVAPSTKVEFEASGKDKEMELIVTQTLLMLPALERKLNSYIKRHSAQLIDAAKRALSGKSDEEKKRIFEIIKAELHRLKSPTEAMRELVVWMIAVGSGSVAVKKLALHGAIGSGQVIATSVYLSSVPWYSALSAKVFGVPTLVTALGGVAGLASAIAIAPIIAPTAELAINHFRALNMLTEIVDRAEQRSLNVGTDAVDIAGEVGKYLQFLPDVIDLLLKLKGKAT